MAQIFFWLVVRGLWKFLLRQRSRIGIRCRALTSSKIVLLRDKVLVREGYLMFFSAANPRSAQNWHGPGETNCLIKKKHCNVISTQSLNVNVTKFKHAWANGGSNYDFLTSILDSQRGFINENGTLTNSLTRHSYISTRRAEGKFYNFVAWRQKDIWYCRPQLLIRALRRFNVLPVVIRYNGNTIEECFTSILIGRNKSERICLKRAVKHDVLITPVLSNLVLDELIQSLNAPGYTGGSLGNDI